MTKQEWQTKKIVFNANTRSIIEIERRNEREYRVVIAGKVVNRTKLYRLALSKARRIAEMDSEAFAKVVSA